MCSSDLDDDLGQTGQMLAALWGAAQATCASALEVDVEGRRVSVRTEVDGGAQEVVCSLPAVVTTDLRCVNAAVFLFVCFCSLAPNWIPLDSMVCACPLYWGIIIFYLCLFSASSTRTAVCDVA